MSHLSCSLSNQIEKKFSYENSPESQNMCMSILFSVIQKRTNKQYHERTCSSNLSTCSSQQIGAGNIVDDEDDEEEFTPLESALKNTLRAKRLKFSRSTQNLIARLQEGLKRAHETICADQELGEPLKVYLSLTCKFYKSVNPEVITEPAPAFNTEAVVVLASTEVQDIIHKLFTSLSKNIDNYERSGSGWVLHSLSHLDVILLKYNPLRASSYIEMSNKIKGFINIKMKNAFYEAS